MKQQMLKTMREGGEMLLPEKERGRAADYLSKFKQVYAPAFWEYSLTKDKLTEQIRLFKRYVAIPWVGGSEKIVKRDSAFYATYRYFVLGRSREVVESMNHMTSREHLRKLGVLHPIFKVISIPTGKAGVFPEAPEDDIILGYRKRYKEMQQRGRDA